MDSNRHSRIDQYGDDGPGARRRYVDRMVHDHDREDDEHVYEELERLRNVVAGMEGDRDKGCLTLGLNNSALSTIFGLLFAVIVTDTVVCVCEFVSRVGEEVLLRWGLDGDCLSHVEI